MVFFLLIGTAMMILGAIVGAILGAMRQRRQKILYTQTTAVYTCIG